MANLIEAKAELSIGRACGFTGIGIGTFMVAMMSEPALSLQTGGIMTLITCLVLVLKASWATSMPYKRTELWLLLDRDERPVPEVAQQVIGKALKDVYLRFALYAAALSLGFLAASVIFRLVPRAI